MKTVPQNDEQLREEVSARYARTALQVLGVSQVTLFQFVKEKWHKIQYFCPTREALEQALQRVGAEISRHIGNGRNL